ncbi:MAG: hypothetical protein ACRBF0_24375 [Calditrichia bacterium]
MINTPAYKRSVTWWLALLFTLLLLTTSSNIASDTDSTLTRVELHYNALDFNKVLILGDSLINSGVVLQQMQGVFLHRTLALAAYNLGKFDLAKGHFLSVLSLQPTFRPDPGEVSPKIIRFFEEMQPLPANTELDEMPSAGVTYIRYVPAIDLRPAAAARSIFVPGWGQAYKGQKLRAWMLGSAFWLSLAGTAISFAAENAAEGDYVSANIPAEISKEYDRYNRWYQTRRGFSYLVAGLWLANVIDANWSPYIHPNATVSEDGKISATLSLQIAF